MTHLKTIFISSTLLAASAMSAHAEVGVVASIKPVHSLVAAVMEGVGKPGLMVDGASSPHTYALKPSQAQMLQQANVIFWTGHELEAFLEKPLETLGANATTIELMDAHDLIKLEFREGGTFEKHDHEGEEKAEAEHDDHDRFEAHIWLDPMNAKAIVRAIKGALVAADPANAAKYEDNAQATMAKLDTLMVEVSAELEPIKGMEFIVFHDAYQYFEKRFGITASGSITVSPEVLPGAARITEIRARVQELGASCVLAEPQFEPKLISTVTEGTQAKSGVIDPLGASLQNGPALYFQLIRNMATSIKTCLSEVG